MVDKALVTLDPWTHLRVFTPARIALGRTGCSMPTEEVLQFALAHARARDAVHAPLDVDGFCSQLRSCGLDVLPVHSAAPDRASYLLRPDLGRRLDAPSVEQLKQSARKGFDVLPIVADGLSSLAVSRHAPAVLEALRASFSPNWNVGPVVVAAQGRVALGDHIGELLQARLVVLLIGERPGLSSPDSLGIYVTYQPKTGRQDAERNCISNVRPQGLDYLDAARKTAWLISQALWRKVSGVNLKDESDAVALRAQGLQRLSGGA